MTRLRETGGGENPLPGAAAGGLIRSRSYELAGSAGYDPKAKQAGNFLVFQKDRSSLRRGTLGVGGEAYPYLVNSR